MNVQTITIDDINLTFGRIKTPRDRDSGYKIFFKEKNTYVYHNYSILADFLITHFMCLDIPTAYVPVYFDGNPWTNERSLLMKHGARVSHCFKYSSELREYKCLENRTDFFSFSELEYAGSYVRFKDSNLLSELTKRLAVFRSVRLPFQCDNCNTITTNMQDEIIHMKFEHPNSIFCIFCHRELFIPSIDGDWSLPETTKEIYADLSRMFRHLWEHFIEV